MRRSFLGWGALSVLALGYIVGYGYDQLANPPTVESKYTTNYQYLLTADSGTSWYNYDHRSQDHWSTNVDWPIRYLFQENAWINKVKGHLDGSAQSNCDGRPLVGPVISPQLCANGGPMYHRENMSGWSGWDTDSGIKRGLSGCQMDYHMRFYARPNGYDYNYNLAYKKHIFASVHRDWEGCQPANYFDSLDTGVSDSSESWFNNRIATHLTPSPYGWSICTNCYDWLNFEPDHYDPGPGLAVWYEHHVQSNGRTSYVTVP